MGTVTTADRRNFEVDPVARERIRKFVMTKVPGLMPDPVGELTCLYTSTPDRDFVLDRRTRIVIISACSGHGAKFAPLTGEIAADLAEGKPKRYSRFAINR